MRIDTGSSLISVNADGRVSTHWEAATLIALHCVNGAFGIIEHIQQQDSLKPFWGVISEFLSVLNKVEPWLCYTAVTLEEKPTQTREEHANST